MTVITKYNEGDAVIVPIGTDEMAWDNQITAMKRKIVKTTTHNFGYVQFGTLHDGFTYVKCVGDNGRKYRTDQLIRA